MSTTIFVHEITEIRAFSSVIKMPAARYSDACTFASVELRFCGPENTTAASVMLQFQNLAQAEAYANAINAATSRGPTLTVVGAAS